MVSFRKFQTTSGKTVLGGKSAENNEKLIEQAEPEETVLHTKAPGSPFVNIKDNGKKVLKKDIKEAATFCAKHSQNWRDNKSDVIVHYFLGKDVYKRKQMKPGTFGVKNAKEMVIKKREIQNFRK
jgi:predicted ribosome quality control (RQC) complex YloA/Tae2 family protein